MALEFTTSYLADSRTLFAQYKRLGEAAMAQVKDADLPRMLDVESNSIVLIVKHLAGNMRSRWTNFLTEDGEKPDRDRDREFEVQDLTRAELMAIWEAGWKCLFDALEPLTDDDLGRPVQIRGERHSVMQAVNRQLTHYASHVGQIIFLAKHWQSAEWRSLSIPRGKSSEFNRQVPGGEKRQR